MPVSNLGVLAVVLAQIGYSESEFLRNIAENSVPWSAVGPEFLDNWAALKNVFRLAATAASGVVMISGAIGAVIPTATPLVRQDGVAYTTTSTLTLAGSNGTVNVLASVTGATTNCNAGIVLSLQNTLAGVNGAAVVQTPGLTGGTETETDTALRTRMLAAWQQLGLTGSVQNHYDWLLDVPGVTQAWVNPSGMGPGTCVVYPFFGGNNFGGFPQGVAGVAAAETRYPTIASGDLGTVCNALFPLQPVDEILFAAAPVAAPLAVQITGLTPSSAAVRASILQAIQALLLAISTPLGMTIYPNQIFQAIQAAAGATATFVLTAPATPVTVTLGYLPTCTSVAYS